MSASNEQKIKSLPLAQGVRFLACDENGLFALEKPAGVRSHPNEAAADPEALLTVPYDHEAECYQWDHDGLSHLVYLINRLDSPTSGVILMALAKPVADAVKAVFKTHHARKTYYAVVSGRPQVGHGTWKDTLTKHQHGGKVRVSAGKAVIAKTEYRTLTHARRKQHSLALLRLSPLTGRTHQLRIQCKIHKHPIIGDQTYGDFRLNRNLLENPLEPRLYLHSSKTELSYQLFGKAYSFAAHSELPASFDRLMSPEPAGLRSVNPVPVKPLSRKLAQRRFRR